jgi:hypothetical protein
MPALYRRHLLLRDDGPGPRSGSAHGTLIDPFRVRVDALRARSHPVGRTLDAVRVALDGDDELTVLRDDLAGVLGHTLAALEPLLEEPDSPRLDNQAGPGGHPGTSL